MITDFEIPRTHVSFESGCLLEMPFKTALAGSCFSGKIADFLRTAGADVMENPTGIVYNPISLEQVFSRAVEGVPYTEQDFFEYGGLFHGYEHHGEFSRRTVSEAAAAAEQRRKDFYRHLIESRLVIVTFGTAVVWEDLNTGKIMANCHKVPETHFRRRLLSAEECMNSVGKLIRSIREANPACTLVLTLSPVRHHPGDPMLNARSKAHLLTAVRAAAERSGSAEYFPAYEIQMDELRDYRFYKSDLVHPSDEAERFICGTFFSAYLKNGAELFRNAVRSIKQNQHTPNRKD